MDIGTFRDYFIIIGALITSLSILYSNFKNGKSQADSNAIESYKAELEIYKVKSDRQEIELKDTVAKLNKQTGVIETLEKTLSLRDPDFTTTFNRILSVQSDSLKELTEMRMNFTAHYEQDKENFQFLKDGIQSINEFIGNGHEVKKK